MAGGCGLWVGGDPLPGAPHARVSYMCSNVGTKSAALEPPETQTRSPLDFTSSNSKSFYSHTITRVNFYVKFDGLASTLLSSLTLSLRCSHCTNCLLLQTIYVARRGGLPAAKTSVMTEMLNKRLLTQGGGEEIMGVYFTQRTRTRKQTSLGGQSPRDHVCCYFYPKVIST